MASGSFAVASSNQYVSCTCQWSSSANTNGNYSTVYFELRASRTNSGYTTYGSGSGSVTINGTPVNFTISSSQKITQNSNTLLGSGSVTVYHNDDGSKNVTISAYASITGILTLGTTSATVALDTIPRASSFGTITGNTIGSNMTVEILRKNSSFTHQLWYKVGNGDWYDLGTGIGTSKTFVIDMVNCWASINATSVTAQLCIRTFNGTTRIGNDVYKDVVVWIPENIVPIVYYEVTEAEGYIDRFGSYIQGKSKLKFDIEASGNYGSTIKSCNTTFDGKTYTETSFTTDALVNSGELDLIINVTDSRGRTTTVSEKIRVMAYNPPRITSLIIKRTDENGDSDSGGAYLTAIFDAEVTRLDENLSAGYRMNEAVFKAKYVNKNDSSDANEEVFLLDAYEVQGGTYTFPANPSSSYDFTLFVDDFFTPQSNTPTTKSVVGGTTSKVFSVFRRGLGYAFNKVAELEGFLDVNFKLLVRKGIWIDKDTQIDYIVEEGEKDGWFYRKWNSGIAECWKLYYENGVNMGANNFNGFYYSNGINVSYPFTFTNLPTVVVDGGSTGNVNFVRIFGNYQDRANFLVIGLVSTTVDIIVSIRAIGKWK